LTVSVIVPTFAEEAIIGEMLERVRAQGPDEIIVVDGGSPDGTRDIARRHARVLETQASRAIQMNAGARAARGDVLLFLHADTRPVPSSLGAIRVAMADVQTVGGALDIIYDGGLVAGLFTRVNRARRRFGVLYGDAGIFCRRSVFEALGGYRPWPILEDYEFARRLWKAGRMALLDEPIHVSDRRWRNGGLFRTLAGWVVIQGLYTAGVSPHRLASLYRIIR
jgi:rSAM/selenodomain-associated transferase 2